MKQSLLVLVILQIAADIVYSFKPNYDIKKQSKSIFSNKTYTETITPARYNAGNHIKHDNCVADNFMPEHNFPDVEYPINILEASKPFYAITGENNALLTPFPDDVITNFNSPLIKPSIEKSSIDVLSENKLKTLASKDTMYKTIVPEAVSSINTKNLPDALENNVKDISNKTSLDSPIEQEVSPQQVISNDKEMNIESEKMTIPINSQEYYNYEDIYYETDFSRENSTKFYDEVEVVYVDENSNDVQNNALKDTSVEDVVYDNNYKQQNSIIEDREETQNLTTMLEPEICLLNTCSLPVEKNKTFNREQKARKRISLGPVQNVKQRKYFKHMNKRPPGS